jgi:hypothetical protein
MDYRDLAGIVKSEHTQVTVARHGETGHQAV